MDCQLAFGPARGDARQHLHETAPDCYAPGLLNQAVILRKGNLLSGIERQRRYNANESAVVIETRANNELQAGHHALKSDTQARCGHVDAIRFWYTSMSLLCAQQLTRTSIFTTEEEHFELGLRI